MRKSADLILILIPKTSFSEAVEVRNPDFKKANTFSCPLQNIFFVNIARHVYLLHTVS
jgi:hypothetical protein